MAGNRNESEELLERARELYVTGQVSSYKELSDRSKELLGQYVTVDTLTRRATADPKGIWTVLRSQNRVGSRELELEDICSTLYLDIMNPNTPAQARAQLTNAYISLIAKGNMKGKASAKTSMEQALDIKDKSKKALEIEEAEFLKELGLEDE